MTDSQVVTSLADEEVKVFQKQWVEKWKPSVDEDVLARAQENNYEQQQRESWKIESDGNSSYKGNRKVSDPEILEAFNKFDKDSSGFISSKDISQAMASIGMDPKDEEFYEMVKTANINEDGLIAYEDFKRMLTFE